jgi:prepilin-type N-terminal cleavage/methylation domain-containing protein
MPTQTRAGFTLIELSIVLVIIGLIVGGVLVGRDLIRAAGIRSQVGQIEKYNAAVNTFRTKYNAVPGDMLNTLTANYGLLQLGSGTPTQGTGDGNGVIEDGSAYLGLCNGGPNTNKFGGEIIAFWRHLSDANLVDGQFGTTGNSLIEAIHCVITNDDINVYQSIPAAKTGRGLSVTVISGRGTNYYALLPIAKILRSSVYVMGTQGMSPIEAYDIDAKIDDGQPETGISLAQGLAAPVAPAAGSPASLIGGTAPTAATTSTLNTCVISSDGSGALATDTYNLIPSTGGNDPSCGLAIRFQ